MFFGKDSTEKDIAVKVVKKQPHQRLEDLKKEADFLLKMQGSKYVLSASEIGFQGDYMFVVMDKIEGHELFDEVQPGKLEKLAARQKISILLQIAQGVKELHDKGIMHRDLKFENILIDQNKDIKIIDLGLSSLISENPRTAVGSPAYVAPETLLGQVQGTPSDIFGLGVIMNGMITGGLCTGKFEEYVEKVRNAEDTTIPVNQLNSYPSFSANKNHGNQLRLLVQNCLKFDPKKRPTIDEVISGLKKLLDQLPET